MSCRICSANDEEALLEQMAEAMWSTQVSSNPDDEWQPWSQAGGYWQTIMRDFARASLRVLRMNFAA